METLGCEYLHLPLLGMGGAGSSCTINFLIKAQSEVSQYKLHIPASGTEMWLR